MYKRTPTFLFVLVDAIGIVAAFLWAYAFYLGTDLELTRANWEVFTVWWFAGLLIVTRLLVYELCGLYDLDGDASLVGHALYGVLATLLAGFFELFALLVVQTYYVTGVQPSRGLIFTYVGTAYVGLLSWRAFYWLRFGLRRPATKVLIVGAGSIASQVWREIERYSRAGHTLVGLVDDDTPTDSEGRDPFTVIGRVSDLPRLVKEHQVNEIVITGSHATRSEMLQLLSQCQHTGARVLLLPELYEVMVGKVAINPLAGVPLIALPALNPGLPLPIWKRIIDIAGALLGLLLGAILHPFIALLIKLDSRGPVFYTQQRVGLYEQPYTLYKYRTMVDEAEAMSGPTLACENDPRITRVGRWLRGLHLDELPQMWNVLWGDMSLVGPRPERPEFVEQFIRDVPAYRYRFLVRPGVTGLAQVHSYYGSDTSYKLRYDVAYMNTMSLPQDLRIIFFTLKVLVTGRRIT